MISSLTFRYNRPFIIRASAVKTTFKDDNSRRNNIKELNKIFYKKTNNISGEELANLIKVRFGKLYQIELDQDIIRVIKKEKDMVNMYHYNRIADMINDIGNPNMVRNNIIKLSIDSKKEVLMEIKII